MIHYKGEKWEFDDQELTPMKAIKKMCLQCMCGDYNAVKECDDLDCPVHQYRPGHERKKISEERRQVLIENLKKAREKLK